jgi:hypothetical protein
MKNLTIRRKNAPKDRALRLKAKVCLELKWTDLQYSEFQFEMGTAYLTAYLNRDEYSIRVMESSRIFWAWWRNHWTNRDETFLEQVVNTTFDLADVREIYRDIHDATTLAQQIYPSGTILNESYAHMITELIKEETQLQ